MAELIEKAITIPDERKEVMEMCLASPSIGDFKPINLSGVSSNSGAFDSYDSSPFAANSVNVRNPTGIVQVGKKHRPGKAGGGWEDDTECDPTPIDLLEQKHGFRYLNY